MFSIAKAKRGGSDGKEQFQKPPSPVKDENRERGRDSRSLKRENFAGVLIVFGHTPIQRKGGPKRKEGGGQSCITSLRCSRIAGPYPNSGENRRFHGGGGGKRGGGGGGGKIGTLRPEKYHIISENMELTRGVASGREKIKSK